jgi:uncharacterized YccA/Bax inhibitor family protein
MARHNVIFGKDKVIQQPDYGYGQTPRTPGQQVPYGQAGYGAPQQAPYGQPQAPYGQQQAPYGQPQAPGQEDLEAIYARPSATGYDTGRMTIRDALNAISGTLGVIIVVGLLVGLAPLGLNAVAGPDGYAMGYLVTIAALVVGLLGGIITGLVNSFKKKPSAGLVLLYGAFEGMALGGLTAQFDRIQPGIGIQAVGATFAVAAVVLIMNRMGVLRSSPRLTKIFAVAMVAYLVFCLVNLGMALFMGDSLRSAHPMLGLVIGALAVVMAAYSLVLDIEDVEHAAGAGVPRAYAWRCAFGVAATLVWMYVEILRIISILRD